MQVEEKILKREEAEAAVAKARTRLDKAKALLEEARALVTVYVVRETFFFSWWWLNFFNAKHIRNQNNKTKKKLALRACPCPRPAREFPPTLSHDIWIYIM